MLVTFAFQTCTDTGTPPASSLRNPSAVAIAKRNIQMIQGKFAILVTKSRRKLQSRKINVEDVQTFLVTLYSSPYSRDGSTTVTVVESAKSLDEIFRALSKYRLWDYLNYYLLQSIIEEFASDDSELKDMMEQYQKDLTGYILALRIETYLDATRFELPVVNTNDSENSADKILSSRLKYKLFKKLTVKVEANVTDHSLSYVNDLWQSLAKQFALPQPAMILQNIAEGCISITWLTPANLVNHIVKMARETASMFPEKHILNVILEEQHIYTMETNPPLLETELLLLKTTHLPLKTKTPLLKYEGTSSIRCVRSFLVLLLLDIVPS